MKRKGIAKDTVQIMEQGYYMYGDQKISIAEAQHDSEENSLLITPDEASLILENYQAQAKQAVNTANETNTVTRQRVVNQAAVGVIMELYKAGTEKIGVLNFASAKNPGGGFLNGAMAQEESLAASSGLYGTQLRQPKYYEANRAFKSMMYTHHAIYSPDVVFFRDAQFELLPIPVIASVLTLPAVNYGQVILKGEDTDQAERVMKERMALSLALFAKQGHRTLVLGAYGCGVFRNDPVKVAKWWKELILDEGYGSFFDEIIYAVLDRSKDRACIGAFEQAFSN
ncbi:hypothetical protein D3C77_393000 [compost metagenome]